VRSEQKSSHPAFAIVRSLGLALPDVTAATRYDGAPVLKRGGAFMAALAMDPSAEPDTLVVRCAAEERQYLLDEAPDTYYVTDCHRKHPVVLVRLARIDRAALREVLTMSWRLTAAKAKRRRGGGDATTRCRSGTSRSSPMPDRPPVTPKVRAAVSALTK
jgi:hypothetical protein